MNRTDQKHTEMDPALASDARTNSYRANRSANSSFFSKLFCAFSLSNMLHLIRPHLNVNSSVFVVHFHKVGGHITDGLQKHPVFLPGPLVFQPPQHAGFVLCLFANSSFLLQ